MTNKAFWGWGWILTPEEVATLPNEVYEEWIKNKWLISSGNMKEKVFVSVNADDFLNMTDLPLETSGEEIAKRVKAFHNAFPAHTDECQWYVLY